MSEAKTLNAKGKFVWCEWMGDDVKAAADFYTHVVGWSAKDSGVADGRPYTVLSAGGSNVAGMIPIAPSAKALGAPPCWAGYLWVEDVDAAAAAVAAAGGGVKRTGADIPGVGRFAIVTDPQGAYFRLFRDAGGAPPPPPAPETPGLVGWRELHASDGAAAFAFYSGLYGWTKRAAIDMGAMGVYQLFGYAGGDTDIGGITTRAPHTSGPFWLYYFNVEAIDAAVERIKARGGKIANGPMEVPGGQWIVQARDREGAFFALVAPRR